MRPRGPAIQNLFVYGSLLYPEVWRHLVRRHYRGIPARLAGYRRLQLKGERYPALVAAEAGEVEGLLYRGISLPNLRRLDRFEGSAYRRIAVVVTLQDGTRCRAQTYLFRGRYRARVGQREWQPGSLRQHERTLICRAVTREII